MAVKKLTWSRYTATSLPEVEPANIQAESRTFPQHATPVWGNLSLSPSLPYNGHFPREHGLAAFIGAKDDGDGSGDNWSYQDVQSCEQIVTANNQHPGLGNTA